MFWIFIFSPDLDFWICGKRSQAHFNISILTFRKVDIFEKCRKCRLKMYICYRFQVSHQGAWCRCCLRRFGDLGKNTPLDFEGMYLVDFVILPRSVGGAAGTRGDLRSVHTLYCGYLPISNYYQIHKYTFRVDIFYIFQKCRLFKMSNLKS